MKDEKERTGKDPDREGEWAEKVFIMETLQNDAPGWRPGNVAVLTALTATCLSCTCGVHAGRLRRLSPLD